MKLLKASACALWDVVELMQRENVENKRIKK